MKSVILAAGISARLRPLTDHIPKCLLKIGDKTILERTLDNLLAYHLNDIAIVTGYLEEQIKNFVARYYPQLNVTYIRNNKYDTTNNIYSLWMTKDLVINNDMLLMNSDKSIAEISKTVDLKHAVGESIGIEKFSTKFTNKLFEILDRKILAENKVNIFYEAAFQEAIDEGEKLYVVNIDSLKCIELDFAEDIERATREVIQYLD